MKARPLLLTVAGLDGRDTQHHELQVGANLAGEIMRLCPDTFRHMSLYVYRNAMSFDNLIPTEIVPTISVADDDFYIVRATPAQQQIVPALMIAGMVAATYFTAGGTAALLVGGMALGGYVAGQFIPVPKVPSGETNQDQASGLNTLGAPHNMARLGSRVPEIFGQMRIYPDLAIPPIEEWNGRTQRVTCLYCIGMGIYDISGFRLDQTFISGLPGVTVTQYGPGVTMPAMVVARQTDSQQQLDMEWDDTINDGTYTAWVTAVGDAITELWVEVTFSSGLVVYKSSGGNRSEHTSIRIDYQRVDIASQPILTTTRTYTAATGNPLRYTSKITGLTPGKYQLRAKRLDDGTHGDDDVHVSNIALLKVIGIEPLPAQSLTTNRRTFIRLIVDNNDQVAQLSSLTFNLVVKRKLRILTGVGQLTDTYDGTSFARDALMYVLTHPSLGNFNINDVDTAGFLAMHAKLKDLDDGKGAYFDGVFDRWTSVDEMAQAIAQVGRCAIAYDGGRIIIMRDEAKDAPVSVFNRRVRLVEDQSTRTMQFLTPDEEDGVSIDWKDATNQWVDRTYIYPETAVNPKSISLLGATHFEQVYRRAVYEMDRRRLRRRSYKITVTEEGYLVNPLDVVTVIDPWLDPVTDGDVVAYDPRSRQLTIDQRVSTAGGRIIRLRAIEGDRTEDVSVIQNSAASNIITLNADPTIPIVPRDPEHQVGTLYVLATVGYLAEHDWHVLDVNGRDRSTVDLNLIEYVEGVFNCDSVTVPPAPPLQ
jgi:hypothetical protein